MLDSHSVHTNLVHSVAAVVIQVVSWKEVWVIGYGNISGGVSSSGIQNIDTFLPRYKQVQRKFLCVFNCINKCNPMSIST